MAESKPIYTSAIIGCGRIGYSLGLDPKREQPASHTMALNANERIRLIAGCDKNPVAIKTWHDANKGTFVYRDSSRLYECQRPDIIVIAVNEESHLTEAFNAIIAHPKLVILEKPVALNVRQALKIQKASERNGVPVLINHERRFASDYALAKSLMRSIGSLQSIRAVLNSGMKVYDPREEDTGNYSLIHDGTHLADILLYLLEEPGKPSVCTEMPYYTSGGLFCKAMNAQGKSTRLLNSILNHPVITGVHRDKEGIVRQFSAHYESALCPDITLNISGRSHFFEFSVEILGTSGKICIGNGIFRYYRRAESKLYSGFYSLTQDKKVKAPEKTGYFANMVQNAVDFLDGTAPLGSTIQNGINALSVLEEIKAKL